ncbi:MAG TPA: citrate/2-methylcitrate synthase [Stellaceae bacterium]|nr:citrate/2-methylcitrate synthase [Stellaceae bacterium]
MKHSPAYLTAAEAAARLGIRPQTLYAYVSRGLIRSEAASGRSRRYHAEDVAALRRQRHPGEAAEAALSFGAPILDSAITLIFDGRLYYRGLDAVELARGASIREVAALLWQGDAARLFAADNLPVTDPAFAAARAAVAALKPVERCLALLPVAAASDARGLDLAPAAVARTAARILWLVAAIIAGTAPSPRPIDAVLAAAWGLGATARPLLRAALILCADHELNVSAFAARCVASAQASPYNAVIAGIAALQGARHGGASERADAFLAEALAAPDPAALAAAYLRRGEPLASFGHPLYPEGDPRARLLLELMAAQALPLVEEGRRVAAAVTALIGRAPNLDFALALLRRALALPEGAALALFLVGRTMGWLAQAQEQYATERLIRPRARYVGPPIP